MGIHTLKSDSNNTYHTGDKTRFIANYNKCHRESDEKDIFSRYERNNFRRMLSKIKKDGNLDAITFQSF